MLALCLLAAAMAADAPAILFHRLRIDYTTTSDWTTLELRNPDGILSSRLISTLGNPTRSSAGSTLMGLNQPLAAAQAGERVGLTVDLAVTPDSAAQPLEFLLKKGSIGGSLVRLSLVDGDQVRAIEEVRHDGSVAGSGGQNPKEFAISLASLQDTPPRQGQVAAPGLKKMVWAFYYPWYNLNSWSSPQLRDRPLTPYSSNDRAAILRHIEQAQSAGIDGFISSWWGPGHYTDQNLKLLLDIAQAKDFAVTVYFETLADGQGRSEGQIFEWLLFLLSTYRDHPAFMKVDGKPLVVVWASGAVPLATWKAIFERLRERGLDAVYLAMSYDPSNLAVFDGLHQYGIFNMANLARSMETAGRAARYYPLLADTPASKIWAATVQPGYDDRLVPGRQGAFKDREDGAFYRSTWAAALASDPHWVFITTWNEWWEHTHVEPSEAHGNQYLDMTADYANWWKSQPPPDDPPSAACCRPAPSSYPAH